MFPDDDNLDVTTPRPIFPSDVRVGDEIRFEWTTDHGVHVARTGIVAHVAHVAHGPRWYTADGGIIDPLAPPRAKGGEVYLISRATREPEGVGRRFIYGHAEYVSIAHGTGVRRWVQVLDDEHIFARVSVMRWAEFEADRVEVLP